VALLEVRGLTVRANHRRILEGLDLTVAEREIHALVGTNGAGKSTLAFAIMGCEGYAPAAGEIVFDGRAIEALPMHERARLGITLAWQEPARFEGIVVRDYITLRRLAVDARECLARVGLAPEQYLERQADRTLSGGERKRLELAAVLALRPRLAILDEPTAGIDLLSLGAIVDVIEAFKAQGASVLLITHQEEVARVADRASLLCGGRTVATGRPDEVIARYTGRACARCDGRECEHAHAV